jgi:ribonuclease P protein component
LSGHADVGGVEIVRLRRRAEFLAAARGSRLSRGPFVLQALKRPEPERASTVGLGITVTRKIGGAVVRNRAKRRLREALRLTLPGPAMPGADYVVVARPSVLSCPFVQLRSELASVFAQAARRGAR